MGVYVRIFAVAVAVTSVLLISANALVDPYRILHAVRGTLTFQPNSRVYKIEFLSRHCADYDSYFVGDSRAQILAADDLRNSGGRRFYNLAAPRDEINSIVPRLKFLLAAGCPVASVISGESIDIVSDENDSSLLNTESPLLSGERRPAFLGKFLFNSQPLIDYFGQKIFGSPFRFAYGQDGHVEYLWQLKNPLDLVGSSCGPPSLSGAERRLLFLKLPAYRELAELSLRYHFQVIVWITPYNGWKLHVFDDPDVQRFLLELRSIPHLSIVDANRSSPMLSDFSLWTDCAHFRPRVFDELVAPAILELLAQQPVASEIR